MKWPDGVLAALIRILEQEGGSDPNAKWDVAADIIAMTIWLKELDAWR